MQITMLVIFGVITYIGFRYALKKAGKKDPIIASLFGALGAMVVGYLMARFVLDRLFTFPQTVEIAQSEVPPISVNATLLVAVVLVLVVFGIQRSKPPAKKG
jgi:divalent metal cation (Fe/Co/Zn/Cd) transporter